MTATHSGPVAFGLSRSARDVTGKMARLRTVEAGHGPTTLLLHDRLSSALEWDDVFDDLAGSGRMVAVDLPGHGASEKPPRRLFSYGFDAFSESIADVIATLGPARVNVIGRGLGALVALTLAATHSALVDNLVLIAPDVYQPPQHWPTRAALWPVVGSVFYKQVVGRGLFVQQLRDAPGGSDGDNLARSIAQFAYFDTPEAREAAHATLVNTRDTRPVIARLGRVGARTLVVSGRLDRRVPLLDARRLARELPRGELEVLECGHSPAEELPAALSALTRAFLQAAGSPSPAPAR
jgi:hypothetical protein